MSWIKIGNRNAERHINNYYVDDDVVRTVDGFDAASSFASRSALRAFLLSFSSYVLYPASIVSPPMPDV